MACIASSELAGGAHNVLVCPVMSATQPMYFSEGRRRRETSGPVLFVALLRTRGGGPQHFPAPMPVRPAHIQSPGHAVNKVSMQVGITGVQLAVVTPLDFFLELKQFLVVFGQLLMAPVS